LVEETGVPGENHRPVASQTNFIKKSVSKLEVKDTKEANKYMLTHQDVDSAGELETQLIKVRGRSWIYN
jgi:hypothetical protein